MDGHRRSATVDVLPHQSGAVCDRRSSDAEDPPVDRYGADPAAHCRQDDRTRGCASAGTTAEPDGGLPPLATGEEEDRRILGRGKMLARLPALSAARAPAGSRRGVSDGLAAESETAGHPAPSSGLGGPRNRGFRG
jgi:hypothetical protein